MYDDVVSELKQIDQFEKLTILIHEFRFDPIKRGSKIVQFVDGKETLRFPNSLWVVIQSDLSLMELFAQ